MRIELVIHHELNRNAGAPSVTWNLAECYRKRGHDVHIYSHGDLPKWLPPRAKQLVFPAFLAAHLARTSRREHLDVVDATTADAWLWCALDPRRRRVGVATTSHGLEHDVVRINRENARLGLLHLSWRYPIYYGGLHLREVDATLRQADVVFVLNRVDAAYAVEELGVAESRIRVVTNGVRREMLGLPFEETPRESGAPIRIAQVASYLSKKGVHYSGAAISQVLERHPDAELTLLGTGFGAEVVLRDFSPSVHGRINVIPRYDNERLPEYLRGHQIAVSPTLTEGWGIGLVEAMACGLAPISTATQGPSEYIEDGHNGVLVPPRNVERLAAALDELISDRERLDRMRRTAQATVQRFTWSATADERLRFYEEALAARHSRAS
jgi:glycosyltransferase involved in cell wall biosynthesis